MSMQVVEGAANVLTNIETREVSLVDRPANRRAFTVKKRDASGAPVINPILAGSAELVAKDASDASDVSEATGSVVAAAASEADSAAALTAPTAAPSAVPEATPEAVDPVKIEEAKADGGAAPAQKADEPIAVTVVQTEPEAIKLSPAVRGALQSGLAALSARIGEAQKAVDATVGDLSGESYVPWTVYSQFCQIDALVDSMRDIGGPQWEAQAALVAGVATAKSEGVEKAGRPMAEKRLAKLKGLHGELGDVSKALCATHKSMSALLGELEPVGKSEESGTPVPVVPAPAVSPVVAPLEKKPDNSQLEILQKQFNELQKIVINQGALLQKAASAPVSNVISVEDAVGSNGKIKAAHEVTWPADLAENSIPKPGRF